MVFKIFLYGDWMDLSNSIISDIVVQDRRDTAFGQGNCTLKTDLLDYNIPPYTIAEIGPNANNTKNYVVCSEINRYLSTPTYLVHNVEIMSKEAILETFTLGTKVFSVTGTNTHDYEKVNVICSLLSEKYDYTFVQSTALSGLLTQENEFNFSNGTTIWSALLEIFSKYDNAIKPIISINADTNTITLDYINTSTSCSLTETNITNENLSQNSQDYGYYLETEASNVVDRDSEVAFRDLTCRAESVAINDDEARIMLPTPIEAITQLTMYGEVWVRVDDLHFEFYTILPLNHTPSTGLNTYSTQVTMQEAMNWTDWQINVGGVAYNPIYYLYHHFFKNYGIKIDDIPYTFTTYTNLTRPYTKMEIGGGYNLNMYFYKELDLTERVVETEYWNTLDASQKSGYAVYTSGDNKIYNLNAEYKRDLIGLITGTSAGNFIEESNLNGVLSDYADEIYAEYGNRAYNTQPFDDGSGGQFNVTSGTYGYNAPGDSPSSNTYNIKCVPISNPRIINSKSSNPLNETAWKKLTRTYNNSANPIDFNKLVKNMTDSNEQLGKPELQIEYDATSGSVADIGKYFTRYSKTWYIMSIQTTYKNNRAMQLINCSQSLYKIADAIGVPYQYESTDDPIKSIALRPLYYERKGTIAYNAISSAVANGNDIYIRVVTKKADNTIISDLCKRACVMTAGDDYYLYIEAIDQYSFDTESLPARSARECKDIPYVDENKEFVSAEISIICLNERLSISLSYYLPVYNDSIAGLSQTSYSVGTKTIYKDAREKLNFTIRVSRT